jgi:hypothetical protein
VFLLTLSTDPNFYSAYAKVFMASFGQTLLSQILVLYNLGKNLQIYFYFWPTWLPTLFLKQIKIKSEVEYLTYS